MPLGLGKRSLTGRSVLPLTDLFTRTFFAYFLRLKSSKIGTRDHYYRAMHITGPRSAVGNVSGYRCLSDCRSRGREFDPSPVPYFRGD